ncbi:MAG: adenosine kinase [Candidatus Eremiobacteraeota bacterium]|nr:adenosine kinase [Candidatus Eremiobacteraeota bacterium]MBC5802985.1 adenosine kinase [Candidatus Eremiobacteraeota bacterium]MBC5822906.1 adenosine kinase [Candidatus Eremiobacteraeota bacterium]
MDAALDVVGIGNAIVDVIASADDAFLLRHGMPKGAMMLIDESRAQAIYAAMGPTVVTSGGSAANTIAGIASLGGRTGFIGKVRDDALGAEFRHDITALGTAFRTPAATSGPATARCLIVVTHDAQRTMNTFLGACATLGPGDLDAGLIQSAQVTYLEGYLYDQPLAQQAFQEAAAIAHAAGGKVALSLSDVFCVERHRTAFMTLIEQHVDILFANEAEAMALFEADDFETMLLTLQGLSELSAVTRSAAGSVIVSRTERIAVPAAPVARVVDTTGAGDLYAAGFLYGLTRGAPLRACGDFGSLAAAEVIGHFGARPQVRLDELLAARSV